MLFILGHISDEVYLNFSFFYTLFWTCQGSLGAKTSPKYAVFILWGSFQGNLYKNMINNKIKCLVSTYI